MDRNGFRNRMKQYKEAKGFNPLLKYWEWKLKYDSAPQPDSMPGQLQPDLPTVTSQPLDDRAHRWDNGYVQTNRQSLDSPYEDARYYDYRKPRFEFRKGDVHYSNPNLLKFMGRFGKVMRGVSLLGETILNLFPSEEAELIEDLRVKMDKLNKWLTGQEDIPKYDEGTNSVLTDYEIPWWQRIINSGEKVQPFTQTDIEQYKNNELQERLARSKYIMGVLSDIGASGKNPIKALYNPTTGGDQLDVFLLNTKDQAQIMEQRGWKKIDTKKEEDPYGIVRTGANYHLTKHDEVPVYENTFDSDTTITREQLTKLFNVSNDIIPGTDSFGNAGSYNSVIYIDKNTGKFYSRSYDLNDYGPTQLSNGFISTVGDLKRKAAEKLDEIGTPFVIRTGFVPVNYYDLQHIANQNPKYKEHINNAKASVEASKIQRKAEGGQVEPNPLEVLERSKPKIAGVPINDAPLENVFSPLDIALGTSYKLAPIINRFLPNYGPSLGALVLGSNDTGQRRKYQSFATKKLDDDVSEFYNDIVIPMNPNNEVYKQHFVKQFGDPTIEIHPTNTMPDNFAADFNPNTNKIRIREDYLNSSMNQQLEAHEYGHLLDKYLPYDKDAQQTLNNSLKVSKNPISKDSDTYREKQSTKREAEFKAFLNLKKQGKLKVKTSRAKTKRYQEYLTSATDEEILELLGADTAYKQDYLAGTIDIDTLRQLMIYAPTIAAGLVIPEYLLIDDSKEEQWI